MEFKVEVLADSLNPKGVRLTTLKCTFPRFILAEVNTHRLLSKNSASSRAIPPEKLIEQVVQHPFIPDFNKRVKGMGVGDELDGRGQRRAKVIWLEAREDAVEQAKRLMKLDVDKSRVNRLLEPFMWHTAVISGTEWDNFLALRTDGSAQPEFQKLANKIQETLWFSEPFPLNEGQWHLPGLQPGDEYAEALCTKQWKYWAMISAGRLTRVSYDNLDKEEPRDTSYERTQKLIGSGHWSPLEHQAQAMNDKKWYANFRGFWQFRKMWLNEDNFAEHKRSLKAREKTIS